MFRMMIFWVSFLGVLPTVAGLQSARTECLALCVMSTGTRTMPMYSATAILDLMETMVSVLFFMYLSAGITMECIAASDTWHCVHVYQYINLWNERGKRFNLVVYTLAYKFTFCNVSLLCSIRPANWASVFEQVLVLPCVFFCCFFFCFFFFVLRIWAIYQIIYV